MTLNPPYDDSQIRQINIYQRLVDSSMFTRLSCSCGGLYYATEEGLICKKCNSLAESVPLFIANGSWNKFRKPVSDVEFTSEEEEDGVA